MDKFYFLKYNIINDKIDCEYILKMKVILFLKGGRIEWIMRLKHL